MTHDIEPHAGQPATRRTARPCDGKVWCWDRWFLVKRLGLVSPNSRTLVSTGARCAASLSAGGCQSRCRRTHDSLARVAEPYEVSDRSVTSCVAADLANSVETMVVTPQSPSRVALVRIRARPDRARHRRKPRTTQLAGSGRGLHLESCHVASNPLTEWVADRADIGGSQDCSAGGKRTRTARRRRVVWPPNPDLVGK